MILAKSPETELTGNHELDLDYLSQFPPKSPEVKDLLYDKNNQLLMFHVSVYRIEHNERILPKFSNKENDSLASAFKGAYVKYKNLLISIEGIKKAIDDDGDDDDRQLQLPPLPTSPNTRLVPV
jgi:hypothetical protein